MKNSKNVFALFSVLFLLQKVNANPNNSSDAEINEINEKLIQQLEINREKNNNQSNILAKVSNTKVNVPEESGKYFSFQSDISSNLLDRFPELTTIINKIITNESKIASSANEDILNTSGPKVTEGIVELATSPKSDFLLNSEYTSTEKDKIDSRAFHKNTNENRYRPSILLGYKPITSFYYPHPVTPAQIIPQGTPWPDSVHGYQTTLGSILKNKENVTQKIEVQTTTAHFVPQSTKATETVSQNIIPAITVLNYKPITSFHHPHPVTPAQIVPTGKPWPDSIEGYQTSIGTKPKPVTVSKTTAKAVESSTEYIVPPVTVLEYVPITSFFHPNPVTPAQIIPSGTLWPNSVEGYETSIGTKPKPITVSTTSKEVENSTEHIIPALTVLGYKPITSFHHPHPVTPAQIVPTGKPWPDSIEGYQTSIGTKPKPVTVSKTTVKEVENSTEHIIPAITVLNYKPITSFFHPHPVTPAQIIPSGTPWPNSVEGYETSIGTKPTPSTSKVNEIQTTTENKQPTVSKTTMKVVQPSIILDYKPIAPSFLPNPFTPAQIIPSGTPWPDAAGGYKTSIGTKPTISTSKVNEIQTTTENKQPTVSKTTVKVVQPSIILDYKPIAPSFLPNPFTPAQIIPSGTPWPAAAGGYETSIGTKPTPSTSKVNEIQTTTENKLPTVSTTVKKVQPPIILDYKPIAPSFLPNPFTPAQIIPSGTPWPDAVEGYKTSIGTKPTASTSKVNELQTTTKDKQTTVSKTTIKNVKPLTILDYKPIAPSFLPNPFTPAQIIPSGTPWPDSAAGYQTSIRTKVITSNKINKGQITQEHEKPTVAVTVAQLISRRKPLPDSTETTLFSAKSTTSSNKDAESAAKNNQTTILAKVDNFTSPPTVMKEKYESAVASKMLVPPGINWPYPAGIDIAVITTEKPSDIIEETSSSVENDKIEVSEITTQKQLQSKPSEVTLDLLLENTNPDLLQPNPLQNIEEDVTESSNLTPIPFTSGTPKTTLSDIADILKEVYNITLVSSTSTTEKPFQIIASSNSTKIDLNYHDVLIPKENSTEKNIKFHVYDGIPKSKETIGEERIVHNPKFDVKTDFV